jgi:glycine dehydrogenase
MKTFSDRHIGPRNADKETMLSKIGMDSIDDLISATIPDSIRLSGEVDIPDAMSEAEYLAHVDDLAAKNQIFTNFIGMGYSGTLIPSVIKRNILENPGWYTAYTPYQAEISQGRLEGLLNFQTMVSDLTGMELANASLLDEGTAASEGMIMLFHARSRDKVKAGVNKFFVDENIFPQTRDVNETRAVPLGIELVYGNAEDSQLDESFFGAMLQYPNTFGEVVDYKNFTSNCKDKGIGVVVCTDLLSLALLTPPGEWGADVVVGNSQRFGVPMGYGGPHAAFFATHEEYKRFIPGRIIGVSQDRRGKQALRMALQTREQHIKRERATSNICTAQALLAIMAGAYAVYHGPEGIRQIAQSVHDKARKVSAALAGLGFKNLNNTYFDTLRVQVDGDIARLRELAETAQINLRYIDDLSVGISLDESHTEEQLTDLLNVFASFAGKESLSLGDAGTEVIGSFARSTNFMEHPVFSSYHSESEMMRYLKRLENKDISLTRSMISLGSCTMKLNAASELYPITNPAFANMHPFAPVAQATGYQEMIRDLDKWLSEITGFAAMSFQPNSGAQGEYAGLMVIRAYHHSRGDDQRNVALIPASAHGTNPASAVMAGMKVVVVKTDEDGNIDVADLRAKAEEHSEVLSALMVTYPSTHGVFETDIKEITSIIHEHGGQVYMDGANMNAQVGLTSPGSIGADVCHLNLHKTFAIPHGGGGPGVGPIGVAEHLVPFLPGHKVVSVNENGAVSAAPWGSSLILLISYGYLCMLGRTGVRESTEAAILNANYIASRLEGQYDVLYKGAKGMVAHEMILDCRPFKKSSGVEVEDIAKRLIDYGFHAPTVSFPVAGTIMVEPTESESIEELDRFCDAMLSIRQEIAEIEAGTQDAEDNVLKNAPHEADLLIDDNWSHGYGRVKAAYPLEWLKENKYWSPVARVDNAYGDRNLVCICPSMEDYAEELV